MTRSAGARMSLSPRYLGTVAAIAVVYFAAAKFGLSLAFSTKQVTALWPPTGIAVAALLLGGYRVWPAIYLAAFTVNALVGDSILIAAGIAVGNTLGPVVARFSLDRLGGFDPTLARVRDVLALALFGAVLGGAVSATNGVATLALGGAIPWSVYRSVWWVWWVGDAMGILVFAPLILSWAAQSRPRWNGAQLADAALCSADFCWRVWGPSSASLVRRRRPFNSSTPSSRSLSGQDCALGRARQV
jgi:integral membrane sensor domain MASE1